MPPRAGQLGAFGGVQKDSTSEAEAVGRAKTDEGIGPKGLIRAVHLQGTTCVRHRMPPTADRVCILLQLLLIVGSGTAAWFAELKAFALAKLGSTHGNDEEEDEEDEATTAKKKKAKIADPTLGRCSCAVVPLPSVKRMLVL